MKRFVLLLVLASLVGISVYLFLRGPSTTGPSARTEEVMALAAQKSRDLQSLRLNASGHFRLEDGTIPMSGTVTLDGVLQDAGNSVQMGVSVDALIAPGGGGSQTFRLQGAGEMIVVGKKELSFKVESLSTEPDGALFQPELLALLTGQWWTVPAPASDQAATVPGGTMTPSPSVLRAQAQVVRVTADRGTDMIDGSEAYHYDVALDSEKLLAYLEEVAAARQETMDRESLRAVIAALDASGEMWIDTETYVLKKVTWDISRLQTGQGTLSGSFAVLLSDFDAAPVILPPADAKPFSPSSFFQLDPTQNVPGGTLTPEQLEQYQSLF